MRDHAARIAATGPHRLANRIILVILTAVILTAVILTAIILTAIILTAITFAFLDRQWADLGTPDCGIDCGIDSRFVVETLDQHVARAEAGVLRPPGVHLDNRAAGGSAVHGRGELRGADQT